MNQKEVPFLLPGMLYHCYPLDMLYQCCYVFVISVSTVTCLLYQCCYVFVVSVLLHVCCISAVTCLLYQCCYVFVIPVLVTSVTHVRSRHFACSHALIVMH